MYVKRAHAWYALTKLSRPEPWSAQVLSDLGFQIGLSDESHELFGNLAILEEDEGRDGADIELSGDLAVFIDVDFPNAQLSGHLPGQFFEDRSDGFAGSAPGGPEIDQYGHGRRIDRAFEIIGGEVLDILGHVE